MKKIKLTIEGMHCASCASNTENSLKKVKGVKELSVSALTHKAIIEAEEDVNEEDLKDAVSQAGFKVVDVKES